MSADPSRVFAQMDEYLDAAWAVGAIPKHFRIAEVLLSDLSDGEARLASYRGIPIVCATEWSWGWMLLVHESIFRWKEHWFNPKDHASVDRNPEGEKPQALSAEHESAAPEADAQIPNDYNAQSPLPAPPDNQ